jgi:hypothetical protein
MKAADIAVIVGKARETVSRYLSAHDEYDGEMKRRADEFCLNFA